MEVVENGKIKNGGVANQEAPRYKTSGPGGIRQISSYLEMIRFPPEKIPEKASEIWEEWLKTGHAWVPTFSQFMRFLEGEL